MDVQRLVRIKSLQSFERQERENVPEDFPEPKKFKCEFAEEVKARGSYSMNCHFFGCIHIIDDDCEALKELK